MISCNIDNKLKAFILHNAIRTPAAELNSNFSDD